MRYLKWVCTVLSMLCIFCGSVAAEEPMMDTATPGVEGIHVEEVAPAPVFETVSVHVELTGVPDGTKELTFALYEQGGAQAADEKNVTVTEGVTSFNLEFQVPAYEIGAQFLLRIEKGDAVLGFIEPAYNEIWLQTYLTAVEDAPLYQTSFYLNMQPRWQRQTRVMVDKQEAMGAYYPMGGDVYVSDAVISLLHVNVTKTDEYVFLSSETGGYTMQFFKDNIYACRGGIGYNLSAPVFCQDGMWYLPLSEVGVYFACHYSYEVTDTEIVHTVKRSAYALWQENEVYVNSRDIHSRTNYLIWISKKDYTVNVYLGSNRNWNIVKSFPCAIGAPRTPTIEGEFEYIERLNRWEYPNYYCGPVMRFYRGYALHSTLIQYNGTAYDDRVGVQISLGCIRLHPEDINWLVANAPMYTKIVITP